MLSGPASAQVLHDPTPPAHAKLLNAVFLALAGWAVIVIVLRLGEALAPAGQWDFDSYYFAARVDAHGGNPYDRRALVREAGRPVFPFVYPHHTLALFKAYAWLEPPAAQAAYLGTKIVCLFVLTGVWIRRFVAPGARRWFLIFAVLGYNAAICSDLVTGNVSIFEQTLIWLGLAALISGRPWTFAGLVLLSAQFKLKTIVLLALLPATHLRNKWRVLGGGVLAGVLIAGGLYAANPEMAHRFAETSRHLWESERGGVKNASTRVLIWDVVGAVADIVPALDGVPRRPMSLPLYVGTVVTVLVLTITAVRRVDDTRVRVYLLLLAYALVMPRMRGYSYGLLIVPTFELLRLYLARARGVPWVLLLVPVAMTVPGSDTVWPYRALVLAWVTWILSLGLAQPRPAANGVPGSRETGG